MVMRVLGVLGSLVLALAACGGGGAHPAAPSEAWQRARAVAEAYLRGRYGEPPAWSIERAAAGAPFLFKVRSPAEVAVLVHDGQVVRARGLAPLVDYLRGARIAAARQATADDLVLLLELFDAFPPHLGVDGEPAPRDYFRGRHAPADLLPALAYGDGERATLTLFYRSPDPGESGGDDGDDLVHVIVWTLAIEPAGAPAWTRAPRAYDRAHQRFVDVDHPR